VTGIPFPTTSSPGRSVFNYCADDSILIQRICDHYAIDVFSSTFFTSPLGTPALQVVYDMIPELFGFDLRQSVLMEKEMAIAYSQRFLCISASTRDDLRSFYPEIPESKVSVAHCGVDAASFRVRGEDEVDTFRKAHGLERDFFLFVGSRVQHQGYKNSRLFFDAVAGMPDADFDVLCVGGEREVEAQILEALPAGVSCRRVVLSDGDLACAYGAAAALVYPSLYEGFGLPVIEAMAAGCPVITTRHGALRESAGDAALFIDGTEVAEMREALGRVRDPEVRASLRELGLRHAAAFRWEAMATRFAEDAMLLHHEAKAGEYDAFLASWTELRRLQAQVDYEWTPPQ
jgi:glycosyltransferase involved in cell wall biosynthesis